MAMTPTPQDEHMTCPLCGHRFDPRAHAACRTCPLHSNCAVVCCPQCGHTTIYTAQSRLGRWFASILYREDKHAPARSDTPITPS